MASHGAVSTVQSEALVLESTIALEEVKGRIDHLTFDPKRQRLYVAELANNSVGVIDLEAQQVVRTVGGFREPQGIAYVQSSDMIYVANGGDGSVRLLRGSDFSTAAKINLGEDADNVWVDPAGQRIYVGHGGGAVAVIDSARREKVGDIPLKSHPEGLQLAPDLRHLFVNVPDAHEIAVVDLGVGRQTQSWPLQDLAANFPMAVSSTGRELWVAFRDPATLAAYNTQTGVRIAAVGLCADADDVLLDARRSRLYVSCGEGEIDVLEWHESALKVLVRISTRKGARTAIFANETDRLYLAVPATLRQPAAIWVYRPAQK